MLVLSTLLISGVATQDASAAGKLRLSASPTSITAGSAVTFRATYTGATKNGRFVLQEKVGRAWTTRSTKRLPGLRRRATTSIRIKVLSAGNLRFRTRLLTARGRVLATSPNVSIFVNPFVSDSGGSDQAAPPLEIPHVPQFAVNSVSPDFGSVLGGETVSITGTGLDTVVGARFGEVVAEIASATSTELKVVTPAHVVGTVRIELSLSGGAPDRVGPDFEFVQPELDEVDSASPREATVSLQPDDVVSVVELPDGNFRLTLHELGGMTESSSIWLGDGHPDAPTGLAGEVIDIEPEENAIIVKQVAIDGVLESRHFQHSERVGSAAPFSRRVRSGTGSAEMFSVKRSFLDCRRAVKHTDGSFETLEPLPETDVSVQVQLTIDDLSVDVVDIDNSERRYYAALISGKPVLKIVAKSSTTAVCQFLPAVSDRLTINRPMGPLRLKVKPDLSVRFGVSGKAVATIRSSFVLGIVKDGDKSARLVNDWKSSPPEIHGSVNLDTKLRVGADASVLYAGVVGLGAKLGPTATLGYEFDAENLNHCVKLAAGFEAEVSARLDLILFEWSQPLFTWSPDFVEYRNCTLEIDEPDTSQVLDPDLSDYNGGDYTTVTPAGMPNVDPETFETFNFGDAYRLKKDLTLESGKNYYFPRPLGIPEGVRLTVQPDVHIKLGHCTWTIHWPATSCIAATGGEIYMNGSKSAPVVITRYSDDSVDGDTDQIPLDQSLAGIRSMSVGTGSVTRFTGVEFRQGAGLIVDGGTASVIGSTFDDQTTFKSNAIGGVPSAVNLQDSRFKAPGNVVGATSTTVARSHFSVGILAIGGETSAKVYSNKFDGVSLTNSSPNLQLSNNTFTNTDFELEVDANTAAFQSSGNSTPDGEPLLAVVQGGVINGAVRWNPAVTYLIGSPVSISAGGKLNLDPGSVVKFRRCGPYWNQYPCLRVDGELESRGSDGNPVVLTTADDDLHGADTSSTDPNQPNGDVFDSPTVGDSGVLDIEHTEILGPNSLWTVPANASLRMVSSNIDVDDFLSSGLLHVYASGAEIHGNRFRYAPAASGPAVYSIVVVNGVGASVTGNEFAGTGVVTTQPMEFSSNRLPSAGVAVNNVGSQELDARNNWWGTSGGPTVDGPDRTIVGPIAFAPWCLEETCGS